MGKCAELAMSLLKQSRLCAKTDSDSPTGYFAADSPRGCFQKSGRICFNSHLTGSPAPDAKLVCWQKLVPVLPDLPTSPRQIQGIHLDAAFTDFSCEAATNKEQFGMGISDPFPQGWPSVSAVPRGSLAEKCGILAGDVLVEVNGHRIESVKFQNDKWKMDREMAKELNQTIPPSFAAVWQDATPPFTLKFRRPKLVEHSWVTLSRPDKAGVYYKPRHNPKP